MKPKKRERYCQDCGEDTKPKERRIRCKTCSLLVCGCCHHHYHGRVEIPLQELHALGEPVKDKDPEGGQSIRG